MRIKFYLILLVIFTIPTQAQDTIYLDSNKKETSKLYDYKYYKTIIDHPEIEKVTIEKLYRNNNSIMHERNYKNYFKKSKELESYTVFYESGKIHVKSERNNGKNDGYFISYWENGKLKRKDLYKKGKFVEGICWNKNGEEVPYYEFEIQPKFPGGSKGLVEYLKSNIEYSKIPTDSKGKTVHVRFSILTDGSIEEIKIVKGENLNQKIEAFRLIENMPNWTPAYQDGKAVTVKRTIPLTF